MASAPLTAAGNAWAKRLTTLVNAGVSRDTIIKAAPVIKQDIKRVRLGSQGMANDEAILSVIAAIKGQPVLKREEDAGAWNPTKIYGDVARDIGDLTWRAVPALAKYVWDMPEHVRNTAVVMSKTANPKDDAWMKAHGYEPNDPLSEITNPSAWARQIRNLSKVPTLGIIPGVHTAAGLTTEEGRKQLARHPVMTGLDVLPIAGSAAKAAGMAGIIGKAAPGSVAEAAVAAQPLKAIYRGVVPSARRAKIAAKALEKARKYGVDPESFGFSRGMDIEGRRAREEWNVRVHESGILDEISRLPDTERSLLHDEAIYPDRFPDPSPEHRALLSRIKAFGDELIEDNPRLSVISRETTIPADTTPDVSATRPYADGELRDLAELDEAKAITAEQAAKGKGPPGSPKTFDDLGGRRQATRGEADRRGFDRPLASRKELARLSDAAEAADDAGNVELAAALRNRGDRIRGQLQGETNAAYERSRGLGESDVVDETPAQRAAKEAAQAAEAVKRQIKPGRTVTRDYVYTTDSEVARAHRAFTAAEEGLNDYRATALDEIDTFTAEEIVRRQKKLDQKEAKIAHAEMLVEKARVAVGVAEDKAKGRGKVNTIHKQITRHEKAIKNLEKRKGDAKQAAYDLANPTNARILSRQKKIKAKTDKLQSTKEKYDKTFAANPPAGMMPMMDRAARDKAIRRVRSQPWPVDKAGEPLVNPENVVGQSIFAKLTGGEDLSASYIDEAIAAIERGDLHQVITPLEWNQIRREVKATWQDVADKGHNPVWVHNVDVDAAGKTPFVSPLPNRNARVSQVKERVGDLTPRINDIAVSMGRAVEEYIRERATARFLDDYVVPRTTTWEKIRTDMTAEAKLMRSKGEIPRGVDDAGALQLALNKHYVEWDRAGLFTYKKARLTGTATVGSHKTYLPRHIADIINEMAKPMSQSGIAKAGRGANKLYKTSIMAFSLKHMAHIWFGGTVFLLLRGGVDDVLSIPKAFDMVKNDKMPLELSRHLDVDAPDQMFQVAAGHTLGRLYNASLGRFASAKWKLDELASNMQRSVAFLGEERRGIRRGMTPDQAKEAGLQHSYKTLVDIDNMNPLERNIVRQVMPFYAFMRHTLRYTLTYPIDHPLRAAILARISDIEQKDWSSGLPQALQTLFFMGTPDAEGNITGVEMRQFNPFRDTGSYFTMAGFLKALHPAAQIPLTIAGVDKFTGGPELYPELQYDPHTGNLVAKRGPNAPWTAATTMIPELGLIDHFGGITADMRNLKARDHEAYKRRLWAMLFVPFEPKTINVRNEAADMQRNLLRLAQQDVAKATETGNTGSLKGYDVVPYRGELVTPDALGSLINFVKEHNPDVAPKSAIPPVKLSSIGL